MEPTCSESLGSGEIILRPAQITYHIDGSLPRRIWKRQVKRKHASPKKCLKIQTKDNPDKPWQTYKHNFLEITFAIEPEK